VLLFLPRNFVGLLFQGTAAAAGLVRDEQLVPRYEEAGRSSSAHVAWGLGVVDSTRSWG
jgi:hypothetical protein